MSNPCDAQCDPDPCDPLCGDPCDPVWCNPCDPQCVDCDDGDPCTEDTCVDGICFYESLCPGGEVCCPEECCPAERCCENNECCPEPCEGCDIFQGNGELSGGEVTVSPEVVCVGETITFTAIGVSDSGGIKRVFCTAKEDIPPVDVSYEWRITKPDGTIVPPLDQEPGTGPVATIVTDQPGNYICIFTASADRDCPPDSVSLGGTKTVTAEAVLTRSPQFIAARTPWMGVPDSATFTTISVTWNPPQCEGTLAIVDLSGVDGYEPPDEGVLTREDANTWLYDAFIEPPSELCPKSVTVWIGAFQGEIELAQTTITVHPVHRYYTITANQDFWTAYNYLRWKYATVLATTGGMFTGGVTISPDVEVYCGIPPFGKYGYACTTLNPANGKYSVVFGTSTFTGTENQAASIIGHELMHTTGASECAAYSWEIWKEEETGIDPCDQDYRDDAEEKRRCECIGICP